MLRALRSEVETAIEETLADLGFPTDDLGIERPPADVDAVLATSVAYRLAGEAGAPPPEVAADIAAALGERTLTYAGGIEAEGAYVNVLPGERYYADTLEAAQEEWYGRLPDRGTDLVLEHTSANPTGPVHVGRARNPIIGDALRRLLDFAGYDVETHYYVNDAGRQIAVFTWAYETFEEAELPEPERHSPEYEMVRYYRRANEYLEDAGEAAVEAAEAEIQAILQGLEAGDEAAYERVGEVVDTVLAGMQDTLDRLPAPFDEFVRETRFMRDGSTDDVVARLKDTDGAVKEEGAWQLEFEDIEKNLVFLRGDGTSLYTTRDIAHHEWKLDNFDEAVTVLGEDHKLQARQLEATLDLLDHDTDRLRTVHYSWVNLPEGGMSTREGTGIDLDDLLDEAKERARAEVEKRVGDRVRNDELGEADIERIARQVGVGAVRYDIVSKQPTKGITFEWERALDFEAQSAPYVQYVHARACGIRSEGGEGGSEGGEGGSEGGSEGGEGGSEAGESGSEAGENGKPQAVGSGLLTAPPERDLLEAIARFPAVVEESAADLEPHAVATYTRDLAEAFNAFYRECPVLDADPELRAARLALVRAARTATANALFVLGVEAPESM